MSVDWGVFVACLSIWAWGSLPYLSSSITGSFGAQVSCLPISTLGLESQPVANETGFSNGRAGLYSSCFCRQPHLGLIGADVDAAAWSTRTLVCFPTETSRRHRKNLRAQNPSSKSPGRLQRETRLCLQAAWWIWGRKGCGPV